MRTRRKVKIGDRCPDENPGIDYQCSTHCDAIFRTITDARTSLTNFQRFVH